MTDASKSEPDVFDRWLRRMLLITSVLAIGFYLVFTVLVDWEVGFGYRVEVLTLMSSLQPMPWMLLLGIYSFANLRFVIRWKLLGKAIVLLIFLSFVSVVIMSLVGWLTWLGSSFWLSFLGKITVDLTSFCFLAVALHALRLTIPYRIDWVGNRFRPRKHVLSVFHLLVFTGLVAGLFVCVNLYEYFFTSFWGSQGFDAMTDFVGHATFAVIHGMIIVTSWMAALGTDRRAGWILGFIVCTVSGFASPLIPASLYGNVGGASSYLPAIANAVFSYATVFVVHTCLLMTGRKIDIRFTREPMNPVPI